MSYIIVFRWPGNNRLQPMMDKNEFLQEFDSEDDAEDAMSGHMLKDQPYEVLEIDV